MLWLAAVLAGCGGGGAAAGGGGGGGAPGPEPGPTDYKPVAAARVEVDVATGQVKVEQLKHDPDTRAIWSGNTVELVSSDLTASDGVISQRSLNLSLKNNTGETIGSASGVRLQFRDLIVPQSGDYRSRVFTTTIAGNGVNASTDGPALASSAVPTGLSFMPDGSLAFIESLRLRVLRNGLLSTVGPAFTSAAGLAVIEEPATKRVIAFVADGGAHRIRWVDVASGSLVNLAGTGTAGDVIGAPGTAQFNNPRGIAWDGSGLLVADSTNGKLKRIPITFSAGNPVAGSVTTFASGLTLPTAVAVDGPTVAVTEETLHRVRLYRGSTFITLGSGTGGFATGSGATGRFSQPTALTYSQGVLYVVNGNLGSVSVVWRNSDAEPMDADSYAIGVLAGTGSAGFAEGLGLSAQFSTQATGLAAAGGRVIVADRNNRRIRAIDSTGISLTAGYGAFAESTSESVDVANPTGRFQRPGSLSGIPYISRPVVLLPRETTLFGRVDFTMEAGLKKFAFYVVVDAAADGPAIPDGVVNAEPGPGSPNVLSEEIIPVATRPLDGRLGSAGLTLPRGVAVDKAGNVFIAGERVIRRYNIAAETVNTIGGFLDLPSGTVDGVGNAARFNNITGLAVSESGDSIYVTQADHVVRVLQYSGLGSRDERSRYSTATILGQSGAGGDLAGIGTAARLNLPKSVSFDRAGLQGVLVDETPGSRVLRITYSGTGDSSSSRLNPANYLLSSDSAGFVGQIVAVDFDRTGAFFNVITDDAGTKTLASYDKANFSAATVLANGTQDADGAEPRRGFSIAAVATDNSGGVWAVTRGSSALNDLRIRRITRRGFAYTVAGGGTTVTTHARGNEVQYPNSTSVFLAAADDGTVYMATSRGLYRISRIMR